MSNKSSNNEIRFRLRSDLQFASHGNRTTGQLVIKDPLQLEFFMFEAFERTLLELLQQKPITAVQLKAAADRLLNPGFVELSEVNRFLKRLLRDNLLLADTGGTGAAYWRNAQQKKSAAWQQALFGVLAIRFRGINPRRLLNVVNPLTQVLFHPALMLATAIMFVVAVGVVICNLNLAFGSDTAWANLSNPRMLTPFALAIAVVKILHELGHALACRSVGRDCHEIGIMLLAFIPCLYCNVSDMWMEPNRWKRMMVSAAGIYVEMLIAIVCVPLWLFCNSEPIQTFLLATILVCSINTLLINGNPLLRYDGYYVLSDLVGVPNLQSVARISLANRVAQFFERQPHNTANSSLFLDIYAVASQSYRWFILGVIALTIYMFFDSWELPNLGATIAIALVIMTISVPFFARVRRMANIRFVTSLRPIRTILVLALVLLLIFTLANIPVETRIYGQGEIGLDEGAVIYAVESGKIKWLVKPEQLVAKGQPIASINSSDLQFELLVQRQLVQECQLLMSQAKLLERQGVSTSRDFELRKQALANAEIIEQELESQLENLTLRSPCDGSIRPLPVTSSAKNDLDLTRTTSTILKPNMGAFVTASEPVAAVAPNDSYQLRIEVPERHAHRIVAGQAVRMVIPQVSPEVLTGSVKKVGIANAGDLETAADVNTGARNSRVVVFTELAEPVSTQLQRSTVHAAIIGKKLPLYRLVARFFQDNFDF